MLSEDDAFVLDLALPRSYASLICIGLGSPKCDRYLVIFGTPASELSRPFAPNPDDQSLQNDSLIPGCNSSFDNG